MDQFDYIVVGTGAAGSVVAARLSEDPGASVCVLEAGPPDDNRLIHIPAGFIKTLSDPRINWLYDSEPSEGTGGRVIKAPRGKTLGGSTAINGHIYSRGLPSDYDTWAQLGNRGWSFRELLPYFKRSERRIGSGDDTYRGREGELVVTDTDWSHPLCEAFIAGAESMGLPRNPDYNGASQEGVSYTQRAIYRHRRVSAYRAFLHPRQNRSNLDVRTDALVTRVLFEGRRATGVRYRQAGRDIELAANREVILCGGAINSPQLLQISGVGPASLLQDLGIDVLRDLPGVGENLRDHYGVRMTAQVKGVQTINERSHGLRLAAEVVKYYAGRPSILGLPSTLVYAFGRSRPDVEDGDVQLSFTPASYHEGVQSRLDNRPGMSLAAWQQRPQSVGYVRAQSAQAEDAPLIQPNYLHDEIDRQVLFGAIRLSHRILRSPPMAPYYDAENTPEIDIDSDDVLWELARNRGTTIFHLVGTCRMGPSTEMAAVVDDQLQVHGIDGLRVADASIMPTMPSCNTNAPSIMIGEKAADLIAGKTPLPPVAIESL